MEIFRFREFKVYKDALEFSRNIRALTKRFPAEEKHGLTSQITRAADSVVLNIAEGSNRYTDLDFSRFLNQANASVSEVVACFDIAKLNKYISEEEFREAMIKAEEIFKQLTAFCSKVRKDSKKI